MYTLNPDTLIRIEDATDPKRGFIVKPWGEVMRVWWSYYGDDWADSHRVLLRHRGSIECGWLRFIHPDSITEI